jgi:two-component system phosphate regulon sensor histidine kinase PhoR
MKRTIFFKIFLGCFLIIFTLTALVLLFSFRAIKSHYIETLRTDLIHLGATMDPMVAPEVSGGNYQQLDAWAKTFGEQIQTRITIIDRDGIVLADSEEDPALMENHRARPEIAEALEGVVGSSVRYSTTVKEEMLYVALPLNAGGKNIGVLRVSLFLKDTNRLLNTLRVEMVEIAGIILACSLIATGFFARSLSKPVRLLRKASGKVASGDFSARVVLKNRDELKDLADSFNEMTEKMAASFDELSHQKEELDSIISSLQEGLVLMTKQGRITLCNESFLRMVGHQEVVGRPYWGIIRKKEFAEWIGKLTEDRPAFSDELELDGKTYLCSAAFLKTRESIVVIFHDITRMRDLEKIKREFVVNVSHELRTPLTAIKGFAETLEEVDERNKSYLDVIMRHTDRLINIVGDLLLLSELEEKEVVLELEDVDLKALVQNILRMFEQRLKEKDLYVRIEAKGTGTRIKADPYRLEQLFINLIDNAVKYTEKGGITISFQQKKDRMIIEIRDTGIGIPEKHLSRIFERFYVTDTSRSRKFGGTGLGLSIVKHIVLLHNGDISVHSVPNEGTTFTVSLPDHSSASPA